jgi:hypothetical protein
MSGRAPGIVLSFLQKVFTKNFFGAHYVIGCGNGAGMQVAKWNKT